MDAHSVVDDWDTAPFDGGFAGLEKLASRGFSGAVEASGTWLFLRAGEPLAVVSDLRADPHTGSIDAFEDASGQRYEAPNPAAATVAAMLALDGEVRGRYFSDDTPLEAVDETLSEGSFTGYVELSENVLSGDYYFVYVDGNVEHVGFVGTSQRLYSEEAETKAKGEVGIYAVVAVDLPRPELPESPTESSEPDATGVGTSEPPSDSEGEEADRTSEPAEENGSAEERTETNRDEDPIKADASGSATAASGVDADEPSEADIREDGDESDEEERSSTEPREDTASETRDRPRTDSSASSAETTRTTTKRSTSTAERKSPEESPSSDSRDDTTGGIEAVTTRRIPSLDPENSDLNDSSATTTAKGSQRERRSTSSVGDSTSATDDGSASTESADIERVRSEYEDRIETYETQIETYEHRIEELESELEDADSRIDDLEAELRSLRDERDELRERLEAAGDAHVGESLSVSKALSGTSLFVRENTRGEGTLEDAHAGDVDRETVVSNLRIEYHTEFEDEGTSVEGEPFESWLRSSDTYEFVEWLVMELLFEIRSTGAVEGLRPLYDALPGIDRIGFEEAIAVGDGTEGREVTFDIVVRDRKGNPLVIVEFDRQRDPTRAERIEPLVTDASDVCEEYESLAGAVAITSSYFESDAMAAVEEATSTSLLSRSKHRSYVKLSRSNGFHLCLVEARDGSFNMTVPEL